MREVIWHTKCSPKRNWQMLLPVLAHLTERLALALLLTVKMNKSLINLFGTSRVIKSNIFFFLIIKRK
jgi:hypothetical protein